MPVTAERPARLRVGVVGAGRVGATLGAALGRAGHRIVAVSAVSAESRARAARMLPGVPIRAVDETVDEADFVLLAVPDDVLRPLVSGLAGTESWRPGQLVAHTSGAHGIGVLDPAAARGVIALALHPVMTFADRPEDLDRLDGATFGVTAPEDLRAVAESLVVEMGGEPVWVPESARALYHAALTVASNHLVTLVNDSMSMLADVGVGEPARLWRRCSAPRWTTCCASATPHSRARCRAATSPPSRRTWTPSAAVLRTSCLHTSRWHAARPNGPATRGG